MRRYLLFYALVVFLLVLSFVRIRKRSARPTPLNLRAPSSGEKPLNAIFVFNGHSWDAYEVLGVPAGSEIDRVAKAHFELAKRAGPEAKVFLDAAFQAIVDEQQRSNSSRSV